MRVRQIDKALDLFECFARDRRPMTLTMIARELAIPKSSAFNIIGTLLLRGYLHETGPRAGYYPTLRLADLSRSILGEDLLIQRLHPNLEALAEETGETVLLSVRENTEIVYLDVVESKAPIRYTARIGQRRPLHTASSGKAILLGYDATDRAGIVQMLGEVLSPASLKIFTRELDVCAQRGWAEDVGGTLADVTGFGVPIFAGSRRLGLAIAGPAYRMEPARVKLIKLLLACGRKIADEINQDS